MIIAGAAAVALLFVEIVAPQIKWWLWGGDMYGRRLKPLDCELCLAFWLGLIGVVVNYFRNNTHFTIYVVVEAVIVGAVAAVIAVVVKKYLNK